MKNKVHIIGVSDVGEKVCAASGRISTQSGTALEIMEKSQDADKNANLISKVTASGHTSTVEHIFFNLAFENVSVVVEQFMIEFRLASFTVKSRRYVDFSDSGYYIPQFKAKEDEEKYKAHMDSLFALYAKLTESGVPKEDARFVLPYCFYSNFFCSLNARELVNVLRAMIFGRGKDIAEIYNIGLALLEDCKKAAPGVFGNFEKQYSNYADEIDLDFIEAEKDETNNESVEILSYTPDCGKIVAMNALIKEKGISTQKAEEILKDKSVEEQVIKAVLKSNRPRPLESACFTVRFGNVSLSTLTHFSRHRMQCLNIPKLSSVDRNSYVIPESVASNQELLDEYCAAFAKTNELLGEFKALGYGESETVYLLLSGNTLDITATMNARELLLFMKLRTCQRAQWEIRDMAILLLKKLREIAPELFSSYGPSCYTTGFCPEGRLTCGQMAQIKDKFSDQ